MSNNESKICILNMYHPVTGQILTYQLTEEQWAKLPELPEQNA